MNAPVSPILTPDFNSSSPAVLLPYQQAWIADKSQLKVAEKSRRIGLTWAEAADCLKVGRTSTTLVITRI